MDLARLQLNTVIPSVLDVVYSNYDRGDFTLRVRGSNVRSACGRFYTRVRD